MTALPKHYFTPAEYLALENASDYKSQYVAGEIFAMAGVQPEHVELVDNITYILRTRFRGRPCRSYSADLRVSVPGGELYTYPDVSALCGTPEFDRTHNPPSLLNPQVIFEVLSPTTEAFDRGDKFARYRRLASLCDYVLVSAERISVEHFARQADGSWRFTELCELGQSLALVSVECELPLAEIYERTTLPPTPAVADAPSPETPAA